MTDLTADSVRQYEELGVLTVCGGIEVARTEERMEELRRRMASAKSWGIDDVSLVTPAEIKELVPFIDESVIVGGFYSQGVGVVDSLRAGTLMREEAQEAGALTVSANTEVLGIDVEGGRVRRVRTDRGDVEAEYVVIACGVWSPRIARMAGASIPLTPAVHQMIDVGPVPRFETSKSAIEFPIVRDMDTNMYERQDGSGLEVGSYAHRPILHDPDEIPSIEESALTPTELPFTQDDFVQQMEHALELVPEILGDESVGIKYAINGLLSLTPDGLPILGETSEVRGLWSAAAVWVKEGPGVGRALAEWMVEGEPEIDLQASDVARFYEHQKTAEHVQGRAAEGFNKTYGIVHPGEQWESARRVRLSPYYEREAAARRGLLRGRRLGAPTLVRVEQRRCSRSSRTRSGDREAEWDSRWWSPIINAEHLAMRDRAAMFDLTAFCVFDIVGPGALECVQKVSMRQMDAKHRQGRLHAGAHAERRLPLGPDRDAARRRALPRGHRRRARDGRPEVVPRPPAGRRHGAGLRPHLELDHARALGPARSRHPARAHARRHVARGLPVRHLPRRSRWGRCACSPRASRTWATSAGSCTCRSSRARGCGTWSPRRASRTGSCRPASASTAPPGRLEKCYRAFGFELDGEYNVVEAGMAWGKVKDQDFVGKEAHVRHREEEPATVMCTLTVDDHTSASGVKRYMLGSEPIVTRDGEPLVDSHGRRSYVTSAGAGPSVGKHILLSYLPPEYAQRRAGAGGRVHDRALPGDRGVRGLHAALRPGQRAREGGGSDPGMRILVCVKRVPLTGGKMVLTADEQALETRHLGFTISPHEECGVEEAVRLVEEHGGEVTVLTLGPAEAEEQIRDSLANGGDRGVHLVTDGEEWDPQATAAAIVDAVKDEEAAGEGFDLIVFGNESADSGNYQVGIRVAYALGRPVATGLKGLSVADGRARCEQEVPGGRDIYDLPLPAVVSVLEGINLPRYPSVPAKLRARSKPVEHATPSVRPRGSRGCASWCRRGRASRPRSSATGPTRPRLWSR